MSATQTKTNSKRAPKVNVLDVFAASAKERLGILKKYESAAMFARVLFAEVLASMYDAVDGDLPALKENATGKEKRDRREKIERTVMDFVEAQTGAVLSWKTVSDWVDAARVNVLLPEAIRVKLVNDVPTGTFGTYSLRALGRIEDLELRSKTAVDLAKSGDVSQGKVDAAVAAILGTPSNGGTPKPIAAAKQVEKLTKKVEKNNSALLAKARIYSAQIDDPDAVATLIEFGRVLWTQTPSDPAVEDQKRRTKKREKVFTDAAAELVTVVEDIDDGIDDGEAKQ